MIYPLLISLHALFAAIPVTVTPPPSSIDVDISMHSGFHTPFAQVTLEGTQLYFLTSTLKGSLPLGSTPDEW
jgi:hypothetical protein